MSFQNKSGLAFYSLSLAIVVAKQVDRGEMRVEQKHGHLGRGVRPDTSCSALSSRNENDAPSPTPTTSLASRMLLFRERPDSADRWIPVTSSVVPFCTVVSASYITRLIDGNVVSASP